MKLWQGILLVGGGLLAGALMAPRGRRQLRGTQPDPRSHFAKKKREPQPVWFVDPNTGEYIELDLTTAKYRREGETEFRGASMLKTIAQEARTPADFARRAEAWNASEAEPMSIALLAKAYRGAKPGEVARLLREAREERLEKRERLWSRMSTGLR